MEPSPDPWPDASVTPRGAGVIWQPVAITRDQRRQATGLHGATVWFTGLPSAGKSSLARAVEKQLVMASVAAAVLDGDSLRHGLTSDLGFTPGDRAENVRRVAHVAEILADTGVIALVALISPYAADRARARELHRRAGLPFIETWLDTPLAVCRRRDAKGLYDRAYRGELRGVTGVDAPYEPPSVCELRIRPQPIASAAEAVLEALRECGVIQPKGGDFELIAGNSAK